MIADKDELNECEDKKSKTLKIQCLSHRMI